VKQPRAAYAILALVALLTACAPAPAPPTTAPVAKAPAVAPAAPAAAPAAPAAAPAAAAAAKPAAAEAPTNSGDQALDRSGSGGTLVIGMSAGNLPIPNTPPNEGGEGQRFVGLQIYDALTMLDLDQGDTTPLPGPGLAESWKVSDDKLTWTFNLRKGVKFHDGTDFNADAVQFQFDRIIKKDFEFHDPQLFTTNRNVTTNIASYRAVDPYTFEIKTAAPYGLLLHDLTVIEFPSPTVVKKYGNQDYVKYATGTGPFKMTKYIDGQVMELEPNADYWRGKPKLDKIVLKPMPDPATRLAALQSGDIIWAEVPPPDSVAQLKGQGFNIITGQYPHTILFFLNLAEPPFDNVKARQALEYAVDREKLCTSLLNGLCAPAYQWAYEGHPWYDPELGKTYKYDPAKAKQLMAEAGMPNGFQFTATYPTGGSGNMWPGPMMEFLQSNFKAVGIDMKMVPLEWNNILGISRAGFLTPENKKYNGMYFSVGYGAPYLADRFSSWRIPPKGCCNPTNYTTPEVDKVFTDLQSSFEPDAQNAALRKGLGLMAADAPVLFVVHDLNLRVTAPAVRGFIQPKSWYIDLRNVWVKK
jgi:peptide/nickel transport system substrate-binding protein